MWGSIFPEGMPSPFMHSAWWISERDTYSAFPQSGLHARKRVYLHSSAPKFLAPHRGDLKGTTSITLPMHTYNKMYASDVNESTVGIEIFCFQFRENPSAMHVVEENYSEEYRFHRPLTFFCPSKPRWTGLAISLADRSQGQAQRTLTIYPPFHQYLNQPQIPIPQQFRLMVEKALTLGNNLNVNK